jgi:hypothetical protein
VTEAVGRSGARDVGNSLQTDQQTNRKLDGGLDAVRFVAAAIGGIKLTRGGNIRGVCKLSTCSATQASTTTQSESRMSSNLY